MGPKRLRLNDDQRRRLAARAKGLGRKLLREVATIVTPETLPAWHRRLMAQKYDGSGKRGCGRAIKSAEIEDLGVRLAKENRSLGYRRIQGALSSLGHEVGRGTIAEILARHGMEPAPERERKTSWKEFLREHWDLIVAANFFTIEAWLDPHMSNVEVVSELLKPFDGSTMRLYPVSTRINHVANDDEECSRPVELVEG